jgi:hypothetical protein
LSEVYAMKTLSRAGALHPVGRAAALLLVAWLAASAAERWNLQYYYDVEESRLVIRDLQFPSARKGMAVGVLEQSGRNKPTAVVTSDGGKTWTQHPLPAQPISLCFLNETQGWLVSENAVWSTTDFGQKWNRTARLRGVMRVFFRDAKSGWAVGARKNIFATADGGAHWERLAASDLTKSTRDHTVYSSLAFADDRNGLIAGSSRPPRQDTRRLPDWMDPSARPREWPATTILLDTRDGGATWRPTVTTMFGEVTHVRLAPDGRGLALVEFFNQFDWPSEVYRIDWRTGGNSRIFRRKDRAVTDAALVPWGPAYLAAIEPAGSLAHGLPGKLRILKSDDLAEWREMDVDYRAVADRAVLASAGPEDLWVATDTGMILRLSPR